MKKYFIGLILFIFIFIISGCGLVNNLSNPADEVAKSNRIKNAGTFGDGLVSFRIAYNRNLEFRVNTGDWRTATEDADGAIISIPTSDLEEGVNTLSVRSTGGGETGSITEINLYKGSYALTNGATPSGNLSFKVGGSSVSDVAICLFLSSVENNELVYVIPKDDGSIEISGGTSENSVLILSDEYEMYLGNIEVLINKDLNLRSYTNVTKIYGKFRKTIEESGVAYDVPFDASDGEVWLHPHYYDGPVGSSKFIGAQDMHTHNGNSDDYADYNKNDGSYEIRHLAGGDDYQVLIFWIAAGIETSTSFFNLGVGDEKEIDITLEGRKGVVAGSVVDSSDVPVADAFVGLQKVDMLGPIRITYNVETSTDASGNFLVETFYGNYDILAGHGGILTTDIVTISSVTANKTLKL